jgi:hypothetical protein
MKSKEKQLSLTKRQLQALPYLLSCPTYEEAARRSGVCVKQIHEWLQQDHFRNELSKRRSEIFQEALSTLKSATSQAITTLVNILSEPDPRLRLSAADKILSNTLKSVELIEFEERLQQIEHQVQYSTHKKEVL